MADNPTPVHPVAEDNGGGGFPPPHFSPGQESCGNVLEAASIMDIWELSAECLAFARRSPEVRRHWEQDTNPHLQLIKGPLPPSWEPA